ncbi:MAG: helix-turn-helix domain-containing protein [Candidatus Kapabacteria bacterium]|nr:helix-turn-helix domain-containing protein [Candidatus Kapabacteria bacterium]
MNSFITSLTQQELKDLICSALVEHELNKLNQKEVSFQGESNSYFTIEDVSNRLHISKGTIHNLMNKGLIHSTKVGRRRLFTESDIQDVISRGSNV